MHEMNHTLEQTQPRNCAALGVVIKLFEFPHSKVTLRLSADMWTWLAATILVVIGLN